MGDLLKTVYGRDLYEPKEVAKSEIEGRKIWLYCFYTTLGDFFIVEYEQRDFTIKRMIYDADYDKARKTYKRILKKMAGGEI